MLQNGLDRSNVSAANQRRETTKKDEVTDDLVEGRVIGAGEANEEAYNPESLQADCCRRSEDNT
jgi:hypothetical protein